jgi:cysteine-S-conjugate beta-lyase
MWNFDRHIERVGTNSVKYDLRKKIFGSEDIIPVWVADMDFEAPDFITEAMQRRLNHNIFGYSFRPPEYFTTISNWHRTRHNWDIKEEWIIFCPGVVPALNFSVLAFTQPGQSIIVQPPVYFPFFSAVESHGRKLIYNQLFEKNGRWNMDIDSLNKTIDENTKMIIISNPHNPVGRAWTHDELSLLAEICIKKNLLILSDEIHCDLVLPGFRHIPFASLSEEVAKRTITCVAPSKTFNLAGLSTSSVIIKDPELRKTFENVIESFHIGNGNIFGIEASIAAYSYGKEWLDALLGYIAENIEIVTGFCSKRIPEIKPIIPEATYMIWLDCRKLNMAGKELSVFFIEEAKVWMNEGSTFGPGGEGYMRMNLATTRENVIKAMELIEKAIIKFRNKKT